LRDAPAIVSDREQTGEIDPKICHSLDALEDHGHTRMTNLPPETLAPSRRPPFLMYGVLVGAFGIVMYLVGVLMVFPRYLLGLNELLLPLNEAIVWYSGIPLVIGLALALMDLLFLLGARRHGHVLRHYDIGVGDVTVALTAYNDEDAIGLAVEDFRRHPRVRRVIVVSNNSTDNTLRRADEAGAIALNEAAQGYGSCVFRCLTEALTLDDTGLIVLCEGDRTFRAYDIDKLIAYAPHADIVNGTRTVEQLREHTTQLTTFMYYGNLFVGKLLEAKHLGRSTITDVGTTYKLCHAGALRGLLPHLDPAVNLEFNAHLLDRALEYGYRVVECPITFHPRVGYSKGGNTSDLRALTVGARMMAGIIFGWKSLRA